jgi:hypothetical protein
MEKPITELKAIIKAKFEAKIKKIENEMEDALSFLSRLEKTLGEETPIESNHLERTIISKESIRNVKAKRKWRKIGDKTAKERVMDAIQQMNAEFSTGELKEKIYNDGNGKEIKKGTFAGIFADLIKEQKIIVVQERKGSQGGLYLKAN